jgi:hypothetical protein
MSKAKNEASHYSTLSSIQPASQPASLPRTSCIHYPYLHYILKFHQFCMTNPLVLYTPHSRHITSIHHIHQSINPTVPIQNQTPIPSHPIPSHPILPQSIIHSFIHSFASHFSRGDTRYPNLFRNRDAGLPGGACAAAVRILLAFFDLIGSFFGGRLF